MYLLRKPIQAQRKHKHRFPSRSKLRFLFLSLNWQMPTAEAMQKQKHMQTLTWHHLKQTPHRRAFKTTLHWWLLQPQWPLSYKQSKLQTLLLSLNLKIYKMMQIILCQIREITYIEFYSFRKQCILIWVNRWREAKLWVQKPRIKKNCNKRKIKEAEISVRLRLDSNQNPAYRTNTVCPIKTIRWSFPRLLMPMVEGTESQ